jgi:hypothetical protein
VFWLSLLTGGNHIFEQVVFQRHAVSAALMDDEELTVAGKGSVFKCDMVVVVVPAESQIKPGKEKSFPLFCVPFCLFDFADDPVVHVLSPFEEGFKKARNHTRAFLVVHLG